MVGGEARQQAPAFGLGEGISALPSMMQDGLLAEQSRPLTLELEAELQRSRSLVENILSGTDSLMSEFRGAPAPAPSKAAASWTPRIGSALIWPEAPPLHLQPSALLGLWLIPVPHLRRAVLRHLSGRLDASLLTYSNRLRELLDQAVEESMDRLKADLVARIEAEASRVLGALRGEGIVGQINAIGDLRAPLNALRAEIEAIRLDEEAKPEEPQAEDVSGTVRAKQAQNARGDCLICQRVVAALFEDMSARQHQLSVKVAHQQQQGASAGFCAIHTWHYEALASPQGVCLAYAPILDAIAVRLRRLASCSASSDSLMNGVAELLPSSVKCPACQLVGTVEKSAAREIVGGLTDGTPGAAASFPPLCLFHLYAVLSAKPGAEQSRNLVQIQAGVFERIAEDMRTYALKHDAIRRELVTNEEHHAHRTALLRLAGNRKSGRGVP
jgi:hypothetical protein